MWLFSRRERTQHFFIFASGATYYFGIHDAEVSKAQNDIVVNLESDLHTVDCPFLQDIDLLDIKLTILNIFLKVEHDRTVWP